MKTQQEVLRDACLHVLKRVPTKGPDAKEAFTPEVRNAVANYMMDRYDTEWTIKSDVAKANPRMYITGTKPTDLMQHWTLNPEKKAKEKVADEPNALEVLQKALKMGLITPEQAQAKVLELIAK